MKVVKDLLSEQIYKILKEDIINSRINFGEVLVLLALLAQLV